VILGGAAVVTSLDPVRVVRADVHVVDGRIAASGGGARRDCSGCLVVPGNVCAHTHLYSALARGMPYALAPPTNFTQILQRIWWRLDRALDEDGVRAAALGGGIEALRSGPTPRRAISPRCSSPGTAWIAPMRRRRSSTAGSSRQG